MTQLELKLANSNSGSCRTTCTWSTILIVFSDGTAEVFFFAVCWWSHTAHACM